MNDVGEFTKMMWRMSPIQLASVAGAALGLAERKARRTVIPCSLWMLSGWKRKWEKCRRVKMDEAPRVWKRLMSAEARIRRNPV